MSTRPARGAGAIEVVGARTHNLRNVSCSIPVGALTVVTGPSGSGKSSLAFDTVYAEGQRRFVESMSTYARQFLERMQRPDVDRIDHILPAIAIEQRAPARSARSTVGTATEIHDSLRLLFSAAGRRACPSCGRRVRRETPESVLADLVETWGEGARVVIAAPVVLQDASRQVAEWMRAGLFRALDASGAVVELAAGQAPPARNGRVHLVVSRARLRAGDAEILSSLDTAFGATEGELLARRVDDPVAERRYLRGLACGACGTAFEDVTPAHFSFNSPRGACPACQGFGRLVGIDELKVIPDPNRSIEERPIAPFNVPSYESAYDDLKRACRKYKLRRDVPWKELTERERRIVWEGEGSWYGVTGLFAHLEKKRYKMHVRIFLARYRGYPTCTACGGARLNPAALSVRLSGKTIAEVAELPLSELSGFLRALEMTPHEKARAGHLIEDLVHRVDTLVSIGLGYLTLSRQVRTLSGGEAQRVQLGSAIGNALTGTLYVLDEPTVGLHARDTERLLGVLSRLASAGNAVLVVEHDLDVIRAADRVIDLGPGAGAHGGRLVFDGTPAELAEADTATGQALRDELEAIERPAPRLLAAENVVPYGAPRALRIVGARAHNLKDLTVEIPLNRLVAVSGVSGSGKSSLVVDVLACGGRRALGRGEKLGQDEIGAHERIEGIEALDEIVLVDQSPLGRSSRSNPATYTKAWDELRSLFAKTESAKAAGLDKSHFSFNAPGGRCETCEGSGVVSIDMQFLADVTVVCDACDGRRFSEKVLAVRLRGRNVDELLETTVDEARELFADCPALVRKLAPLHEAGLGYLRLGQSTATLSGGEAQRLKIASFLGGEARGKHVLFVFDEPTTGLHPNDVGVLLRVLNRLVSAGHSVVAVEHNLGFLARADHLIELGPEGGDAGGRVVFSGSPRSLVTRGTTPTADALRARVQPPARPAGGLREATIRR